MDNVSRKLFFVIVAWLFCTAFSIAQPNVIVDLDIDSDVDDVSALAMLNTMHNKGQIKMLGVIVTSDDSAAASCVGVINTYFGNQDLPIGVLKNQSKLSHYSRYTKTLSEEFPHEVKSLKDLPEAKDLYRKLLAGAADESVIIITIGHLTNFQNLLQSRKDRSSKYSGKTLAQKKVRQWICMGGQFPEGKEANFYRPDPASTVYCLREWNKPVVFAGWEVGQQIVTGGEYLRNKIPATSPVYRAYERYNNFKGRASWDQVAVLLLTEGFSNNVDYVADGYCEVAADGSNKWVAVKKRNHSYIRLKPDVEVNTIARTIDDMVVKESL